MASFMESRQTKYGVYLTVYLIVVLGIIGAANWLAYKYNKTTDVTANKRFTLSEQTTKVVSGLKSDVNLYYFDKTDGFERARDILDRYKNLSPKLKINYVDPDKSPDIAKMEGAREFGAVVVDNGTKKEVARGLSEEELTGAIIRTIKNGARNVCFVTGSGEHPIDDNGRDGFAVFKDQLDRGNYKTKTISLLEKPEVPADCTVVVVGGPQHDYLPPAIDAIKKFVNDGGRAVVTFDPVLNLPSGKLGDTPNIAAMVQEWGVTANGDIVLDMSTASQFLGQTAVLVGSYEQHPIVRDMKDNATVFPLARSLKVASPAEKLWSSGAESYSLTNPKTPLKVSDIEAGAKGPFVLGAAATIGSGDEAGRVVVTASTNWLSNSILSQPFANRDLALNTMNWLTSDEDLISIRPKEPEDRRLKVTGNALRVIFLASVILIPLMVIFSGVSMWWKRR